MNLRNKMNLKELNLEKGKRNEKRQRIRSNEIDEKRCEMEKERKVEEKKWRKLKRDEEIKRS